MALMVSGRLFYAWGPVWGSAWGPVWGPEWRPVCANVQLSNNVNVIVLGTLRSPTDRDISVSILQPDFRILPGKESYLTFLPPYQNVNISVIIKCIESPYCVNVNVINSFYLIPTYYYYIIHIIRRGCGQLYIICCICNTFSVGLNIYFICSEATVCSKIHSTSVVK